MSNEKQSPIGLKNSNQTVRLGKGTVTDAGVPVSYAPALGNDIILPIGAGSVVTRDILARIITYVNPAQTIYDIGSIECTTGLRDKQYNYLIGRL